MVGAPGAGEVSEETGGNDRNDGDKEHRGRIAKAGERSSGEHGGKTLGGGHDQTVGCGGTFALFGRNAIHEEAVESGLVHPLERSEAHVSEGGDDRTVNGCEKTQKCGGGQLREGDSGGEPPTPE